MSAPAKSTATMPISFEDLQRLSEAMLSVMTIITEVTSGHNQALDGELARLHRPPVVDELAARRARRTGKSR